MTTLTRRGTDTLTRDALTVLQPGFTGTTALLASKVLGFVHTGMT